MINEKFIVDQLNSVIQGNTSKASDIDSCIENVREWVGNEGGYKEIENKINQIEKIKTEIKNKTNEILNENPDLLKENDKNILFSKIHKIIETDTEEEEIVNYIINDEDKLTDEIDDELNRVEKSISRLSFMKKMLFFGAFLFCLYEIIKFMNFQF